MSTTKTRTKKRIGTNQRKKTPELKLQGWLTSDEEERERRRIRGVKDSMAIESTEPQHPIFGSFQVCSNGGSTYTVEVRSTDDLLNSCNCPDYSVSGLGTCKHIEAVLHHLNQRHAR